MAYEFAGLVRQLRPFAEALLAIAGEAGLNPRVTSTRRSHADQKRLYEAYQQGRSKYPVAPPGQSAHEYGWAFDMDVFPHSELTELGRVWEGWGGTWGRSADPIHFELPGATAALRRQQAPTTRPSPRTHTIAAAADIVLAFIPGIRLVTLGAWLLSFGFPRSKVLQFLSGPISYVVAR